VVLGALLGCRSLVSQRLNHNRFRQCDVLMCSQCHCAQHAAMQPTTLSIGQKGVQRASAHRKKNRDNQPTNQPTGTTNSHRTHPHAPTRPPPRTPRTPATQKAKPANTFSSLRAPERRNEGRTIARQTKLARVIQWHVHFTRHHQTAPQPVLYLVKDGQQ
jgi:hypothetical protein